MSSPTIPSSNHNDPYNQVVAVTPNDTTDLTFVPRAIYIGGTGNVSMDVGGVTVLFNAMQAGRIYPIRPSRIRLTSTSATGIVALY